MMKLIYKSVDEFLEDFLKQNYKAVVMSGLPGSGKSTVATKISNDGGYEYISSDEARVEVMKLTKGKYSKGASEYLSYREKVYEFIRDEGCKEIENGKKLVFDATYLNDERVKLLERLRDSGLKSGDLILVYVEGGDKEAIRKRILKKPGKNGDGRSWEEAWEVAYDWFVESLVKGLITKPIGDELGFKLVIVENQI